MAYAMHVRSQVRLTRDRMRTGANASSLLCPAPVRKSPTSCSASPASSMSVLTCRKAKTLAVPNAGRSIISQASGRMGRPVEFRDMHRYETLTSTAEEFMRGWLQVLKSGPDDEVMKKLDGLMDSEVKLYAGGGLTGVHQFQGVPEVKTHLINERARYGGGLTHQIRVLGANEDTDVVFVMIESKPSSLTDHSRPFVEVLKLDLRLDDGFRQITSITTRRHLSTHELGKLVGGNPLGRVLDAPSPMHLIERREEGVAPAVMNEFGHKYCNARTSAHAGTQELAECMDNAFEMYDPLGLVPLLKSSDEVTDQAKATAGVVGKQLQLQRLTKLLARYNVETTLRDTATARDSNVGFVHWYSQVTTKSPSLEIEGLPSVDPGDGQCFVVEGLDVVIFDKEGGVRAVWAYRDPMDWERDLMR